MIIFHVRSIKRSNLRKGQCCWIKVSAPLMCDDMCCGKPTVEGSGFCHEHKIKADAEDLAEMEGESQ